MNGKQLWLILTKKHKISNRHFGKLLVVRLIDTFFSLLLWTAKIEYYESIHVSNGDRKQVSQINSQ